MNEFVHRNNLRKISDKITFEFTKKNNCVVNIYLLLIILDTFHLKIFVTFIILGKN